jgi:RNA polymerase subunit RPABC4/transcription elongation factor Spt4
VQTCSRCQTKTSDTALACPKCQADLREFSTTAVALKKFRDNPRVKLIRLVVSADACPACQEKEGTFEKNRVPVLPVEGCSDPHGCNCYYEPLLDEVYP